MKLEDYSLSIKSFVSFTDHRLKQSAKHFLIPTYQDEGFLFALALNSKTILHATKQNNQFEIVNTKNFSKKFTPANPDIRKVFYNSTDLLDPSDPTSKRILQLLKDMEPLCF